MRLLESSKQTVTVRPAAASEIFAENGRLYRFDNGQGFTVSVVLQPMDTSSASAVYGDTPQARLLMLTDGGESLEEGMGVCVDVTNDSPCDYRIAAMPRHYKSHNEFTLAFIPPEQRG